LRRKKLGVVFLHRLLDLDVGYLWPPAACGPGPRGRGKTRTGVVRRNGEERRNLRRGWGEGATCCTRRSATARCGQVHHAPYPLQQAELADWDESLLAAARITRPEGAPLVHFASGVDVEIFGLA
jgi:hypothetical protein